jgi:predicted RNA-binding Zn ribbon-like protein
VETWIPDEPRIVLDEPLAVDFANTTRRRGADEERELLGEGADLVEWAQREGGRVPVPPATAAADRLDEVRALRDDVKRLLRAAVEGDPLPRAAATRVNERLVRAPVVPQLGQPALRAIGKPDPLDELLGRVAASVVEVVGAGPGAGLGFCEAPSCGQFFIQARPNQRWCGPPCGTRARVARHAAHAR